MPFIDSKVSVKITKEQETELKSRLGQAISLIPGKSEQWLMAGFEDDYHLYFRGDDSEPMAFIEVRIFGGSNRDAFSKMTAEITKIFNDYYRKNGLLFTLEAGPIDDMMAKLSAELE